MPPDDDVIRYFQLCSFNAPRQDNFESIQRWMMSVKPLIKEETRFLEHPDDMVTAQRDFEDGTLEHMVERLARQSTLGNKVLLPR